VVKFQTVRGMRDFLPVNANILRHVQSISKEIAEVYAFEEIITPLVEHYDLLAAKSGREIESRMYVFKDLGNRKVVLRPEFTASVARLIATSLRNEPKPLRLFSTGPAYRYDEPQFGRYREFWQSNYEIIGSTRPEADVEILSLSNQLLRQVGLRDYRFKIGHVGILRGLMSEEGVDENGQNNVMQLLDTKRIPEAVSTLHDLKVSKKGEATFKKIIKTKGSNIDSVLDEAKRKLKEYPDSVDSIENLRQILTFFQKGSENLKLSIETGFARGLEYYTGMIFEPLIAQMEISLGGGGRYDRLVEIFGGEPSPAVGVAIGLDRVILATDCQKVAPEFYKRAVALIPIGEGVLPKAIELTSQLRSNGIAVELEIMGRTVARALKHAARRNLKFAIILGKKELEAGKLILRDMSSHEQHLISVEEATVKLQKVQSP
jgi:histidyl-tRNA synthetase